MVERQGSFTDRLTRKRKAEAGDTGPAAVKKNKVDTVKQQRLRVSVGCGESV